MRHMRAQVLSLLCLGALSPSVAAQSPPQDVMINVLLQVDGKPQLHLQKVSKSECEAELNKFRIRANARADYWLAMESPKVEGLVLDMKCVSPDGSTRTVNDPPPPVPR